MIDFIKRFIYTKGNIKWRIVRASQPLFKGFGGFASLDNDFRVEEANLKTGDYLYITSKGYVYKRIRGSDCFDFK